MKNHSRKQCNLCIITILQCLLISSCQKQSEDSTLYKLLNPNYKHDTIRTVNVPDNQGIIDDLNKELVQNNMTITAYDVNNASPEYSFVFDCVNMIKYDIESTGMRLYSIKSDSKRIKYRNKHQSNRRFSSYYQEFKIRVYEFESEEKAKRNFDILDKASHSGDGNCNRIFNTQFVLKKNEIFEFATMDEKSLNSMRNYIVYI